MQVFGFDWSMFSCKLSLFKNYLDIVTQIGSIHPSNRILELAVLLKFWKTLNYELSVHVNWGWHIHWKIVCESENLFAGILWLWLVTRMLKPPAAASTARITPGNQWWGLRTTSATMKTSSTRYSLLKQLVLYSIALYNHKRNVYFICIRFACYVLPLLSSCV